MVRFHTFLSTVILERFTSTLTRCGVDEIVVSDLDEGRRARLTPATHDAVEVIFTAHDESLGGKIMKSIISGAQRGEFGSNKIFLNASQIVPTGS